MERRWSVGCIRQRTYRTQNKRLHDDRALTSRTVVMFGRSPIKCNNKSPLCFTAAMCYTHDEQQRAQSNCLFGFFKQILSFYILQYNNVYCHIICCTKCVLCAYKLLFLLSSQIANMCFLLFFVFFLCFLFLNLGFYFILKLLICFTYYDVFLCL